jgi:hypothetical protein
MRGINEQLRTIFVSEYTIIWVNLRSGHVNHRI